VRSRLRRPWRVTHRSGARGWKRNLGPGPRPNPPELPIIFSPPARAQAQRRPRPAQERERGRPVPRPAPSPRTNIRLDRRARGGDMAKQDECDEGGLHVFRREKETSTCSQSSALRGERAEGAP